MKKYYFDISIIYTDPLDKTCEGEENYRFNKEGKNIKAATRAAKREALETFKSEFENSDSMNFDIKINESYEIK